MYVIIGANGYIGSYFVKNVLEHTADEILAAGRSIDVDAHYDRIKCMQCDVCNDLDLERVSERLSGEREVKAVYLAAYHHPDKVKENPELAWNVNITALSRVLNSLGRVKCFFYISTEMVYGEGTLKRKFREDDELNPVNLYGRQKKAAEAVVLGYGFNVVRFPFVIGASLLRSKKHFYDVIVDTLRDGRAVEMFEDAYKSALDFDTATELVIRLIENYSEDMPKIINVSGDAALSKYEIGLEIARKNKLNECLVKPVSLYADHEIFSEKRAGCTLLDNSLIKKILNIETIRMKF